METEPLLLPQTQLSPILDKLILKSRRRMHTFSSVFSSLRTPDKELFSTETNLKTGSINHAIGDAPPENPVTNQVQLKGYEVSNVSSGSTAIKSSASVISNRKFGFLSERQCGTGDTPTVSYFKQRNKSPLCLKTEEDLKPVKQVVVTESLDSSHMNPSRSCAPTDTTKEAISSNLDSSSTQTISPSSKSSIKSGSEVKPNQRMSDLSGEPKNVNYHSRKTESFLSSPKKTISSLNRDTKVSNDEQTTHDLFIANTSVDSKNTDQINEKKPGNVGPSDKPKHKQHKQELVKKQLWVSNVKELSPKTTMTQVRQPVQSPSENMQATVLEGQSISASSGNDQVRLKSALAKRHETNGAKTVTGGRTASSSLVTKVKSSTTNLALDGSGVLVKQKEVLPENVSPRAKQPISASVNTRHTVVTPQNQKSISSHPAIKSNFKTPSSTQLIVKGAMASAQGKLTPASTLASSGAADVTVQRMQKNDTIFQRGLSARLTRGDEGHGIKRAHSFGSGLTMTPTATPVMLVRYANIPTPSVRGGVVGLSKGNSKRGRNSGKILNLFEYDSRGHRCSRIIIGKRAGKSAKRNQRRVSPWRKGRSSTLGLSLQQQKIVTEKIARLWKVVDEWRNESTGPASNKSRRLNHAAKHLKRTVSSPSNKRAQERDSTVKRNSKSLNSMPFAEHHIGKDEAPRITQLSYAQLQDLVARDSYWESDKPTAGSDESDGGPALMDDLKGSTIFLSTRPIDRILHLSPPRIVAKSVPPIKKKPKQDNWNLGTPNDYWRARQQEALAREQDKHNLLRIWHPTQVGGRDMSSNKIDNSHVYEKGDSKTKKVGGSVLSKKGSKNSSCQKRAKLNNGLFHLKGKTGLKSGNHVTKHQRVTLNRRSTSPSTPMISPLPSIRNHRASSPNRAISPGTKTAASRRSPTSPRDTTSKRQRCTRNVVRHPHKSRANTRKLQFGKAGTASAVERMGLSPARISQLRDENLLSTSDTKLWDRGPVCRLSPALAAPVTACTEKDRSLSSLSLASASGESATFGCDAEQPRVFDFVQRRQPLVRFGASLDQRFRQNQF